MKYHPQKIIYWAVSRYLTIEELDKLKNDLINYKSSNAISFSGKITLRDNMFLTKVKKHFNLERMLKNPLIPEDAWLFNYIEYDTKPSFPRNKLISRYEREIVLLSEKVFTGFLKMLTE